MQHKAETLHEDEDSHFSSNAHNLVTDPTDPPIVSERCVSRTSRLMPLDPVGCWTETRSCHMDGCPAVVSVRHQPLTSA